MKLKLNPVLALELTRQHEDREVSWLEERWNTLEKENPSLLRWVHGLAETSLELIEEKAGLDLEETLRRKVYTLLMFQFLFFHFVLEESQGG